MPANSGQSKARPPLSYEQNNPKIDKKIKKNTAADRLTAGALMWITPAYCGKKFWKNEIAKKTHREKK